MSLYQRARKLAKQVGTRYIDYEFMIASTKEEVERREKEIKEEVILIALLLP